MEKKKHRDSEVAADWLQSAGIDAAALSQLAFMGHDDEAETAAANDALLESTDPFDQFYTLVALPVGAGGETALAEFERCVENGYNGGVLETRTGGIEVNDAELDPVLEYANDMGAPIFVHPKVNDSLHPDALDESYHLNAIFGREGGSSALIKRSMRRWIVL